MSETPPTPGSERKRNPNAPTSISTRVWVAGELNDFRKLLTKHGDAVLLPDVLALAQEKKESDEEGYPGWLALGLAIRQARLSIEIALVGKTVAEVQQAFASTEPAPKPKRGSR